MKRTLFAAAVALLAIGSGCSTLVTGTSQKVNFVTEPAGGACEIYHNGVLLTRIDETPGHVRIPRSKYGPTVRCSQAGYEDKEFILPANFAAMTLGNAVIGGVVGVAIDSASGATHNYPTQVTVKMQRQTAQTY
ncbi:MAG: hypothetical protein KTR21_15180 [Rhodobacteraceae bacterium]|nr:hypothetical protein [Paracoccaceae bacterium]